MTTACSTSRVVARGHEPAGGGAGAQHVEVAVRDQRAAHRLGLPATLTESCRLVNAAMPENAGMPVCSTSQSTSDANSGLDRPHRVS